LAILDRGYLYGGSGWAPGEHSRPAIYHIHDRIYSRNGDRGGGRAVLWEKRKMTQEKVIILHETLLQSILSDIVTVVCLLCGFYLNYRFIGQSLFLDAILFFMALSMILNKGKKSIKKMTIDELSEYVKQHKKE
jgi:hypothetical protein